MRSTGAFAWLFGWLALLSRLSALAALRLPVGGAETARQATRAAVAALRAGERRVQLTLPPAPVLQTARSLVHELEADGLACRVFLPRALLPAWLSQPGGEHRMAFRPPRVERVPPLVTSC